MTTTLADLIARFSKTCPSCKSTRVIIGTGNPIIYKCLDCEHEFVVVEEGDKNDIR